MNGIRKEDSAAGFAALSWLVRTRQEKLMIKGILTGTGKDN
jgi:hypothetical protein